MILLQGYAIGETVYQGGSTTVFRGIRTDDGAKVVCKLLRVEYPRLHELASFRREYEIGARFPGKGTVRFLALERANNSLAIVMEDIGGESLERDAALKTAGIDEKLRVAASIAEALEELHRGQIIHKDINPSNIIRNRATHELRIVDFGIAAELSRETAHLAAPGDVEGTLAYLSPEQTGRMNRPLDHRADLYSLGVTLFELFTGRLPFQAHDPLDWVHAHMARVPPVPHEVQPDVPETVSAIILKLLAKTPEARYQSAAGLLADLERCRDDLARKGSVGRFAIGQADRSDQFAIPGGLYGRDEEVALLRAAYATATEGTTKLVLLAGAPGVGKTSLVQELRKYLPEGEGFLVAGKYHQLDRNLPYSGLFRAFQELTQQILSSPAEFLQARRQALLDLLGGNAGLLGEKVPALASLIGKTDAPPPLDPVAAHHRWQAVARGFLEAFVRDGHRLVLFLDDLQWADSASLELLRQLLGAGALPRLLLLGAYRDNEVREGQSLASLLKALEERCEQAGDRCARIALGPLGPAVVTRLLADTLRRAPEDVQPLTALVQAKTDGNPFFIHHLLTSLHAHGAFAYRATENHWDIDLDRIATAEPSDNVADFLARRLRSLPEATTGILRVAACIGNTFDLRTLAGAFDGDPGVLHAGLWDALAEEILVPLDRAYRLLALRQGDLDVTGLEAVFKFGHDRLWQAARSLLDPADEVAIHHRIGRAMLAAYRESGTGASLFVLVDHLNLAQRRVTETEERRELARLNLMAAGQAMTSTAFKKAAEHYEIADALLTDEDWGTMHAKPFDVRRGLAEARFLAGDPQAAEEAIPALRARATGNLDRAAVFTLTSRIRESRGDLAGALAEIRAGLGIFGLDLPETKEAIEARVGQGLGRMQQGFAQTPIDKLALLPRLEDPEQVAAMRLLAQAVPAAIQHNYQLYMVATMMMLDLTLAHGLTPESCKCVADCGIIYSSVLGDYETGYRLGRAAFALIDRLAASWQRPPVCFSFTYVSHMRKHFSEGMDHYEQSYRSGLEVGDLQHAFYARAHQVHLMAWIGTDLAECRRTAEATIAYLSDGQGIVQLMLANLVLHAIRKLEATPTREVERELAKIDGETMAAIGQSRNMVLLVRFAQYNAFLHFLLGETAAAERWNATAESVIFASGTDFPVADHYLVRCLLAVDRLRDPDAGDREATEAQLAAGLAKLKKFADHCPENFAHKHLLVTAEVSALRGEPLEATLGYYRQALAAIGDGDFTQMVALINERQGAFWIARGDLTIAKAFLREARYYYGRWGAFRKVEALEAAYRHHFPFFGEGDGEPGAAKKGTKTHGSSRQLSNASLDITSITKSTQTISSEIRTGNLLRTLLQTIVENAGAERGCFLLAGDPPAGLRLAALRETDAEAIEVLAPAQHPYGDRGCREVIEYVGRTREAVVLDDAATLGRFKHNDYIKARQVKSVLCMPVLRRKELKGIVYLENNLVDHAFTTERLSILAILTAQAAISIENAQLYEDMEGKVRERTKQLNDANERLKQLTLIDPLTHLNNRRFFHDYIAGAAESYIRKLHRARAGTEKRIPDGDAVMGVFLIDLDHFKQVNDTWGHAAGDSVLVGIAKVLKSIIRSDDFIVRWGGEEFLVILNNTNPGYLDHFARKALAVVRGTAVPLPGQEAIAKTCSIGYTQIPFHGNAPDLLTLEQTIKLSDYALYVAKQHGRNRAVRIGLREGQAPDQHLKDGLLALSQNAPNEVEGIELRHFRPEDEGPPGIFPAKT